MGYDIRGSKLKSTENIVYIQCQYGYTHIFKEALGEDIMNYNGRVTAKNYKKIITDFNKIIKKLESNIEVQSLARNISNRSKEAVVKDFKELIENIENRKIRYLSIS